MIEAYIEQVAIVNGVEIVYRQNSKKYDAHHLVVVLSGFGAVGEFTYDFERSLLDCPAEVIWIKDSFLGHASYYFGSVDNHFFEGAIVAFIEGKLAASGLTKEDCTFLGASKGGSAALLIGVRHGFKNIVATVPQTLIGSYVRSSWPAVAAHMAGNHDETIAELDALLLERLKNDTNRDRNIYLFSSKHDEQYQSHVEPILPVLRQYQNFNCLMANSVLIRMHSQVTAYCLPIILSIINTLTWGAIPRMGEVELKAAPARKSSISLATPYVRLKKLGLTRGKLFLEGIAILRGLSCPEYRDIDLALILRHHSGEAEFPLGKVHKPQLSKDLFDGEFFNYDKGWFCSLKGDGIEVIDLPVGNWDAFIRIKCRNVTRVARITADEMLFSAWQSSNRMSQFVASDAGAILSLKELA